jgi:hypothetical protein
MFIVPKCFRKEIKGMNCGAFTDQRQEIFVFDLLVGLAGFLFAPTVSAEG